MYPLEWIDRWRSRRALHGRAAALREVSPVVWALGFTSLLTDIASEMVASVLPAYLVLHLRMSPLQFGVVDAAYRGVGVIVLGLTAAVVADRTRRLKVVALVGYGVSALCKLALLAAGTAWGAILAAIMLDRAGKGIRTAPRDALISLNAPRAQYATAFAAHRALDAAGAMLGPILAFVLLARAPTGYDLVWIASFLFAVLGVAALALFVPGGRVATASDGPRPALGPLVPLGACAFLLSLATISDGFLYLQVQERGSLPAWWFPLYAVGTSLAFMLGAIPLGRLADRIGRGTVFLAAYAWLAALYAVLLLSPALSPAGQAGAVAALGVFYAGTEGVLVAMVAARAGAASRTRAIAVIAACIAAGRIGSSLAFGALWTAQGARTAVTLFLVALVAATMASAWILRTEARHA